MLAIHDLLQGADPRHDQVDTQDETPARIRSEQTQRANNARQRRLARDLAAAVSDDAFVLHYQPRIALRRGAWTGAEALLRWPHKRRGLLQPAEFLDLAERTGHLMEIGAWVLRTACADAKTCGLAGVSVNISSRQLVEGMLLNQIAEALEVSGLDPDQLEIEITETILTDAGIETLLTLSAIRDLGVGIALDDFGTGFASLAMLKRLPLTAMKLDNSLIRDVPFDHEDAAI
jgi:EAL domain-containing protein (putative c-di-GMP-specific phosphodiesterase class I)